MKSTVTDVARRAGVSVGTVSNSITGKRPVAPETHERIKAAMKELGYQPNLMARALVNNRSHVISVVVRELSDLGLYAYNSAMTSIQHEAVKLGYSIMLHFVNSRSEKEVLAILNNIRARRSDGVIWAIHEEEGDREWIRTIGPENFPPIIFLNMHPITGLNVVSIDNCLGAQLAVSHLVEQGRKKICIITGPAKWWETECRLGGWRDTLAQAGLENDPSLVVEGDWYAASGQRGMQILLDRRPDIDAVFASSDLMALGAIHTANSRGLTIPGDLLLVGYDDIPEAASFWPPLTSVKQDFSGSGQIGVDMLRELIETPTQEPIAPRQETIQPKLIVRRSSLA
jgi:LacI family transcriptional regulator